MGHPAYKSGVAEEIWRPRPWCPLVEKRDEWGSLFRAGRFLSGVWADLTGYNLREPCDPFFDLRCWRWYW
jgi:hypothetical protein